MDIREEIRVVLIREQTSMRQVVQLSYGTNYDIPNESTLSYEFKNKRIRFSTVQDILDMLGYEFIIRKKQN